VTWAQPACADHEKFCQAEGWQPVRDARGRTGTHRVTYELVLHDGRILRTRTSHPVDRSSYGQKIWSHILTDQLEVDQAAFRACVHDGIKPNRGAPESPAGALPAELVNLLLRRVGLSEAEVAAMTRAEAIAQMQQYWASGD
jgi:hypothetical protein